MPLEVLIQLSLGYDWRRFDDSLPQVVVLPKQLFLFDCRISHQDIISLIMSIVTLVDMLLSFGEFGSTDFAIDADISGADLLEDLEMLYVASVAGPLLLITHIEIEYNQMEVLQKQLIKDNHTNAYRNYNDHDQSDKVIHRKS